MTKEERDNAIRCIKKWSEENPYLQTYKTCLKALEQCQPTDAADHSTKEEPHLDDWADYLHKLSDGEMSCDRNICVSNEYNGIGCDECICNTGNGTCQREDIEEAIPVEDPPCEEKVSAGVLKQVMWERDIAISQLNELGYGFGQKMWIDVKDFLPEERENPITMDFYEYPCTYKNGDVCEVRYYKFGDGHWWHGPEKMDEYVTAWMMIPEPYKENK